MPDGYLVGVVRLFAYWQAGVETVRVSELPEADAQAFLTVLAEWQSYL